jgi:hypothetical protein
MENGSTGRTWVFGFGFLWVFAKTQFHQNEAKEWVFGVFAFLVGMGVKRFCPSRTYAYSRSHNSESARSAEVCCSERAGGLLI